ncbi:MAG: hypothetical protein N4J56_004603 [Chroococcidiopsis sp. SAG 2025]|uniref:hypothetical protein n=1 Tax=Chroococcidiopsis sp. SAG 2025 TaxID=171389 RepID=UPI002937094A|nr:hypothetical protein [Chroococcidiopsis sp. SAG 2025]MDV2994949.1 hypothetical protein [Chroococcidiopsis sp. SAG 2025]
MSKSRYWLKYFLLGIGLSLLILLGQPGASRARLPVFLAEATQKNIQQHHKARSLTQAGHKQLDRVRQVMPYKLGSQLQKSISN